MHPRRGFGPFMALGKRPGVDPTCLPPPMGWRPTILGFPVARRMLSIDTTTSTGATADRSTVFPWRYR